MSADCETVSQTLAPEHLQHPLTLQTSVPLHADRHQTSRISYEGRVSVISPLGGYDAPMQNSFGVDPAKSTISPPHIYSPSYKISTSSNSIVSNEKIHLTLSEQESNYGPSKSDNRYDSYNNHYDMDYSTAHIKQEDQAEVNYSKEQLDEIPAISSSQMMYSSSVARSTASSMMTGSTLETPSTFQDTKTPTMHLDMDLNGINNENENSSTSDQYLEGPPSSPYNFNDMSHGPSSVNSDQNESREIDPVTFMRASFNGSHDMFNLHGENSKALKCQFCPYSTDDESSFSVHLNTHFIHKCMKCEFTSKTVESLKDHLQIDHGIRPEDVEDFESMREPIINSQGKVKTFKCKQCGYIAVTKGDFWTHAKSHIKSEKLLSCNKCPFVTEYKHHLEYHMRNHLGSKPFKCTKCNYSCVNKSMLNSHMKSHSNIYQYRCSDCTYATKYCHSLKLHLRKYGHSPAMVLNPDGSPNPVPIIDVYGTRRGPKLKKDENGMPILPPHYQLQAHIVRAQMEITGTIPPAPTVPLDKSSGNKNSVKSTWNVPLNSPSFSKQLPSPFLNNVSKCPSFIPNEYKEFVDKPCETKDKEDSSNQDKNEDLNVSKSPEVEECFSCEICNFSTASKDILSHHMLLHNIEKQSQAKQHDDVFSSKQSNQTLNFNDIMDQKAIQLNLLRENMKYQNEKKNHMPQKLANHFPGHQSAFHNYFARAINPLLYPPVLGGQTFVHPALEIQQQLQRFMYQNSKENPNEIPFDSPIRPTTAQTEPILDLSKEQTPPNAVVSSSFGHSSTSPPFLPASPPNSDISTPPSKHRRKGRAYKLERIALRLSGSGEDGEYDNPEIQNIDEHKHRSMSEKLSDPVPPLLPLDLAECKKTVYATNSKLWGDAHQCQYCDIAFKDIVMYTMHMGYHGYKDPFTCNMCGFDAQDKVAFFLHIGRSSHL